MNRLDDPGGGVEASPAPRCSPHEAAQVLHVYGREGGYPPGSFVGALLAAITRADPCNRALLARGFPGLVAACELVEAPGGVERLTRRAAGGAL